VTDIMKISRAQLFWIVFTFQCGNTLLFAISWAINQAKQDAWISTLVALFGGIFMTFVSVKLSLSYPNQTLVQFSQKIFGKWFAHLIIISFLLQWYTEIGDIIRIFAQIIVLSLFEKTPFWVIVGSMILMLIYIVHRGGIESIARVSELVGPIILVMVIVLLIFDVPNINWHRMLPVYADSGWFAILKGSVTPMAFFCENVMLTMLLVFIDKPKGVLSQSIWGLGVAGVIVSVSTLIVTITFGPLVAKMWYPFYMMTRLIKVMDFLQNMDAVIIVLWFLSCFVKLAVYMFIASYGTAQWLHIKDWRKVIWVVAAIAFIYAMWNGGGTQLSSSEYYEKRYWVPYAFPINMIGLPLLLWTISLFKKRFSKRR
jgi:spore germination protein KB